MNMKVLKAMFSALVLLVVFMSRDCQGNPTSPTESSAQNLSTSSSVQERIVSSTVMPMMSADPTMNQMNVGYAKDHDMMDVLTMKNMTKAAMKFIDMYNEQSAMDSHDSMSMMEPMIDVSDDPMLTVVKSESVESMSLPELTAMDYPAAKCAPYDQVITLPNDKTNVLLSPSCIVIKQCGGCCGVVGTSCRPTKTEPRLVKVMKYVNDNGLMWAQTMVDEIMVEEHKECDCLCTIQEQDCNLDRHTYSEFDCACECKNATLASTCQSHERWNNDNCSCECANESRCEGGKAFNRQTCRCESIIFL
ncbi:platelet-derived growth factor C-like [Watersipora subatra]|uniref:platelet-derived growth factor C-like n=1 Tax=Watersipora subatra TaxID=2589382 RepID=UPI00355B45C4